MNPISNGFTFGFQVEEEKDLFNNDHEPSQKSGGAGQAPHQMKIDQEELFEKGGIKIIPLPSNLQQNKYDFDSISLHSELNESLPIIIKRVRLSNKETKKQLISEEQHSDLIPGVYEGGLKTWECSIDLCEYLYTCYCRHTCNNTPSSDSPHKLLNVNTIDLMMAFSTGSRILELGCGHGLPGILIHKLALCQNKVFFSDYNDYVLESVTWPNVILNFGLTSRNSPNFSMVAGDWMDLSFRLRQGQSDSLPKDAPGDGRFDLILAAETLYSGSTCKATALLLFRHLVIDSGAALVSTKRYYFGVGGGTDLFFSFLEKLSTPSLKLQYRIVKSYDSGMGNIRDIILVQLNSMN